MRGNHETPEQRFDRLYRETSDDVLAYLVRRSRTVEDAADALAETYAAAWRKLDSLPDGNRARLWLFGAARIELRKAAGRTRADDELIVRLAKELEAAPGQQLRAADPDEALWLAVFHLSARDQEILALTAWEGLAPREIAAVMGMSANAARKRLQRARRDLQRMLKSDQYLEARPVPVAPHSSN
jgi:RNA polymerase sigma-70 factor (ECF subfamily)